MMDQENTMGDPEVNVEDQIEEEAKVEFWPNVRRMLRLMKQCWPMFLLMVAVKILARWAGFMENVVGGGILDAFVALDKNAAAAQVTHLCFWYVLLVVSNTIEGIISQRIVIILSRTVRMQLYTALMKGKSQAYFDEAQSGVLASRLSADCRSIAYELNSWAPSLVTLLLDLGYCLSYMAYTDWRLMIAVLVFIPLSAGTSWLQTLWESPLRERYFDLVDEANAHAAEALLHSKTVRIFGQQEKEIETYRGLLLGLDGLCWKLALASGLSIGFVTLSYRICLGLTFWYGGSLVLSGELTSGQFLAFCMFAYNLSGPIFEIPYLNSSLNYSLESLDRVYSIIEHQSAVDLKLAQVGARSASDDGIVPPSDRIVKGHLEFKNVTFVYPSRPGVQVLQDFNMSVSAGSCAALVGSSGGGKSTIVSLLVKLYEPSGGQITLDGVDIATLNSNWLRQQIGFVTQEPVLFSGTIRENICYGLALDGYDMPQGTRPKNSIPVVSQQRVEEAAKRANAHDFILALPRGYDTRVGEHGSQLSAGQRQRIAIARAILRDPKILIADEATSALDYNSERLVQQALDRLMVGRTCIVIAHRLSTIRQCDPICVIGQGKIREQGTHAQLLSSLPLGLYAGLHALDTDPATPLAKQDLSDQDTTVVPTEDSVASEEKNEPALLDAVLDSTHPSKPRMPVDM